MSRTKGSPAQAGPPHWRHAPEPDLNANPHLNAHPHARQPAPTGQYQNDPYAAPQAPAQPRGQQPSHFPHEAFRHMSGDRHAAPQARPAQPNPFDRAPGAYNQSLQDRLGQQGAGAQQHRTYSRPAPQAGWPNAGDPAGYDLAHYAPEQHAPARSAGHDPYAAHPAHAPYAPNDAAAAAGWSGAWNGHQHGQGYAEPSLDAAGYAAPEMQDYSGHALQGAPEDQDYVYEDETEAEPARRGPRVYVIAGALVGAIAVGGVLAYGYKTFGGRGDGKTPVIRADTAPAKTRPTDPGGKEVAHTDKKFINRLGDDKPGEARSETATLGDTDSGGPRKVTTLVVNRDGSMAAPNPVVSQGSAINGSGVPGMLIEGLNSGPARPQLRGTASSEGRVTASSETQAPTPQAVPQKPQVIAKASAAPEAPPRPTKKPAEREEAEASPSKTAVASAAPPQPATGANGYVPVLASQKSRMDALKAFADIQQKYGDALQNGTPDVREVNLGEKGVWHRLMLGPPGSRESAKTVCTQLKALGYSGCWVTAY